MPASPKHTAFSGPARARGVRGKKVSVRVKPQVLRWAIASMGWQTDELAKKVGVRPEDVAEWGRTESSIDLRTLKKIARQIKRPPSTFLLPRPPDEPAVAGFGPTGGSPPPPHRPSKELCDAMRHAREVQFYARDLLESHSRSLAPMIASGAAVGDDPEQAAGNDALVFKTSAIWPKSARTGKLRSGSARVMYGALRAAVEARNILVLQYPFPLSEARGFALTGDGPAAILVNSRDAVPSRMFTLLHEYAHILLGGASLCSPDPESLESASLASGKDIEEWCDAFARAVLMPKGEFVCGLDGMRQKALRDRFRMLAATFRTSERAALVRAIALRDGDEKREYMSYYSRTGSQAASNDPSPKGSGAVHPAILCLSRRGRGYVNLVLESEQAGLIDEMNVAQYLDLSMKHFDRLLDEVERGGPPPP